MLADYTPRLLQKKPQIVVRLKTEYNDLVLDAQKKELMLTKIAEEARSGAARLDEMHAGMIEVRKPPN